ncbi:MAG: glutamate 5-kinase, partial [Geminicoccaceae bacterium]|nr:glutamate 5-kinase [Geminicoccaceae bacterium]
MSRRLVVKIGSSLLVDPEGTLRRPWLASLAADLAALRARGTEVIVVTSGAIALGRGALGLRPRGLRLEEKQAAAAVGQIGLAQAYQAALEGEGIAAAQILLTLEDTENRRRYLNARATLDSLLRLKVVPIVNENDTVATSEIRFGDNDRLSARVAVMASADELILLSDVDGLYTADPGRDPSAVRLERVDEITPETLAMAGGAGSAVGTGGMASKLAAAKIATGAGCPVVLAPGGTLRPLQALEDGGAHTRFAARANPRRARKDWIAGSLAALGAFAVDDGAAKALRRGSSLLPAGVRDVSGHFERGDAVLVTGPDGREIAKGLSAYDAPDARRIIGRRTEAIEAILGWRGRDELIHRDDLV